MHISHYCKYLESDYQNIDSEAIAYNTLWQLISHCFNHAYTLCVKLVYHMSDILTDQVQYFLQGTRLVCLRFQKPAGKQFQPANAHYKKIFNRNNHII